MNSDLILLGHGSGGRLSPAGSTRQGRQDRIRRQPLGRQAAINGQVSAGDAGRVRMQTMIGGLRAVDMLAGEHLPRNC